MNNFIFKNPVKLIFGSGQITRLSNEILLGSKVMITYGGGSIFKNGVYDKVMAALKGFNVVEFGGIEANPDYATLVKAVEKCRKENVNMLLAVGGGSVIDGTKFIAAAVNYNGDPWEFMKDASKVPAAMPFGTVLTLPATGSEMNNGAVISRRETHEKFAFNNESGFPKFSILDPTVIYSLPKKQIANGIIDTYAHTLEQYLTTCENTIVMDKWAEALFTTLIELAPKLMANEHNYDACANFMLTATMGLNGFVAMGVTQDWSTHMIGHELTALHGLDHAVTLAIVYPGIMRVMKEEKRAKLLRYAYAVWGITAGSDDERISAAIIATEKFFNSLGVKTKLNDYGIDEITIAEIVKRFTARGWNVGENGIVTPQKAEQALRSQLK
ncbi:MAG: iron-containing alcohol dehydrogenase [Bacteroidales bacterium]